MEYLNHQGVKYPIRPLTEEEKRMPLTIERIHRFLEIDKNLLRANFYERKVFNGFLMAKHPEHVSEIIRYSNNGVTMTSVLGDENTDLVYSTFCEFVNLTENTLVRANTLLITLDEYDKMPIGEFNLVIHWHTDWEEEYTRTFPNDNVESWGGYVKTIYPKCDGETLDKCTLFNCTEEQIDDIIAMFDHFANSEYECNFWYDIVDHKNCVCDREEYTILSEKYNFKDNNIMFIETAFD